MREKHPSQLLGKLFKTKVFELSMQVRLPFAMNTPRAENPFGLYLSRRIWILSHAPPTPTLPTQRCTAENKRFCSRNSRRTSPQGHGNSLSPFPGVGGGFFPDGNLNEKSGGRPSSNGKAGVSSRKPPGSRETL
ncbi:hypothetical protein CDAR_205581 [Caerostris darwini]|uniref:Uncharacterized protein n=1 Tax=Caerostris darwini TaxID=1538125 RepID=A0AAV4WTI8_9ARAC|nr:hypothetical protein CDAR_205581 [Caerostris darwini]